MIQNIAFRQDFQSNVMFMKQDQLELPESNKTNINLHNSSLV